MKDYSGSAFPQPISDSVQRQSGDAGMTLREYLAAHAPPLPRFVIESWVKAGKRGAEMDLTEHAEACAKWARLYADAMLMELAE